MSEHESFVKQKLSGVALRSKDPERSEWARLALLCERVQRMSGLVAVSVKNNGDVHTYFTQDIANLNNFRKGTLIYENK